MKEMNGKKTHVGKIIKRKPNWAATILAILILGAIYCYFGADLAFYDQAVRDRDKLAEQAAKSVYNTVLEVENVETVPETAPEVENTETMSEEEEAETFINGEQMDAEMLSINLRMQEMNAGTDLGEYFARNDLTVEGRKTNETVRTVINVIIWTLVLYVALNIIRVFGYAASKRETMEVETHQS